MATPSKSTYFQAVPLSTASKQVQLLWGCELIQESGILMKLDQVVLATAQVLFHAFYKRHSVEEDSVLAVAMSSIFLAAKVEEDFRYVNDIVNVFDYMICKRTKRAHTPVAPGGEVYNDMKEVLLHYEKVLLAGLGFSVYGIMEHPHKFILYYAKTLELSNDVAQKAWNYLNDSLRTDLNLRFPAEVLACAAILLASRYEGVPLPRDDKWCSLFGADVEEVKSVAEELLRVYDIHVPQWLSGAAGLDVLPPTSEAARQEEEATAWNKGGVGAPRATEGRRKSRWDA